MPHAWPIAVQARPAPAETATDGEEIAPPADLCPADRAVWQALAPAAAAQGTLTWRTRPGFRLLCEVESTRLLLHTILTTDGRVVDGKPHPLTTAYDRAVKQAEILLARYRLAPSGRADVAAPVVVPRINPWAQSG